MSLSQRDIEVLAAPWQCMDVEPKIDYAKLATIAGYKNKECANVTFRNVMRKVKAVGTTPGTPSTPKRAPATPKSSIAASASGTKRTSTGKAKSGNGKGDQIVNADLDATPSKRSKKVKTMDQGSDTDFHASEGEDLEGQFTKMDSGKVKVKQEVFLDGED